MLIARERSRTSQPEIRQRSQAIALSCSVTTDILLHGQIKRCLKLFTPALRLLNLIEFAKYNLSFVYTLYQSFLTALEYLEQLQNTRPLFFVYISSASVLYRSVACEQALFGGREFGSSARAAANS